MPAWKILSVSLIAFVALISAHGAALHYYLYWRIFWFDNVSHLLGGLTVGLFIAWLYTVRSLPIGILPCMFVAFAIGAEWEVYEYVSRFPISPFMSYPLDTAKDLLMDVIGGAMAWIVARRLV